MIGKAGSNWTFGMWLEHWLENIARPHLRQTSYSAYRVAVTKHLIPGLGSAQADQARTRTPGMFHQCMMKDGSKPATAHQVHRTARVALGEALRRGHVKRNVAKIAKGPRLSDEEIEPYSIEDAQRIMTEAEKRRNSARWAVALSLGLRQGEALALRWSDVDLDAKQLRVKFTLLRPIYEHGCGDKCGRDRGFCPQKVRVNPLIGETKSRAGKRVIGLPDQLVSLIDGPQGRTGRGTPTRTPALDRW